MAFFLVIVLLSILALAAIVILLRTELFASKDAGDLSTGLRPIDVEAFHNLINANEETYLREHLPPAEFRKIQRERILAVIGYVRAAASNAGVLSRIAQNLVDSPDPTILESANRLFEDAVGVRIFAIQLIPRLYVRLLLPGKGVALTGLVERYDFLSRQAVALGCLRRSTEAVR